MAKLTEKQKRFADEYLIDLNATQAAIRAGYSTKVAKEIGYENLTKPHIREHVDERMKDREKRTEITQDRVLEELAHIAFDDISNYLRYYTDEQGRVQIEVKDSEEVDTRNISEISYSKKDGFKFKLYGKDSALVNVGKHLGMFKERIEHTGEMTQNVNASVDLTKLDDKDLEKLEEIATKLEDKPL